jgi:hypothetical protein
VVEAPGAADSWYVAGLELSDVDGAARAVEAPSVEHGDLTGGATLRFAMSGTPTSWGVPASAGVSTGSDGEPARPWQRADGGWNGADGPLPRLTDGDLTTAAEVAGVLEWRPSGEAPSGFARLERDDHAVAARTRGILAATAWSSRRREHSEAVPEGALLRAYTLTSSAESAGSVAGLAGSAAPRSDRQPPSAWRLVADDGRVLDERSGEQWSWPGQLRPFVLAEPIPLTGLRLELGDGGVLAQVELLID